MMRTEYNGYIKDSQQTFFQRLQDSCSDTLDITQKYHILRDVFYRCVEQRIHDCPIAFVGLFAKIDYIIKEDDIPSVIASLIHEARKQLFAKADMTGDKEMTREEILTRDFPHNLKAIALLVSYTSAKATIPAPLKAFFPKADRIHSWGKFSDHHLRVIVEHWDEQYIWATEEEHNTSLQIAYGMENTHLTRNGQGDWSYLKDIIHEGTQLNLLRLRFRDHVCMPELIIYEPDYLINVTTIAGCFESYAESPYVNLINKLKPSANSIPILLGNLASQYLDDTIHQREASFAEGVTDFFHHNALSMITCPEMADGLKVQQLYRDAQMQKTNIEQLIGNDLPDAVGNYRHDEVILEPSFYSDMLGIQGRLDFLADTGDHAIIIEQKSGKGGFKPGYQGEQPLPQEKHLVQLLLYRGVFTYEFNKSSEQMRHIMLLYSKYSKGLISTAQMPELFLRAIRMRNLIAWTELSYANDGLGILESLTPDKLNRKNSHGKLWEQYTKPELINILAPIRLASPLERKYYLRFLKFLQQEQMLSKLGNKQKENSGFASLWQDTLDTKIAAGSIYSALTISEFIGDGSSVSSIRLAFPHSQSADTSNFRKGDIIILYPYHSGHEPYACSQIVHRATIVDITTDGILLRLRNSQTDRRAFTRHKDCLWAVEHDMMEASDGALYRAMHSFLSATKDRRDLIMCQRPPIIDTALHNKGNYGGFDTLVTHAIQSREMFLIIGPPGTGKTSFGLVNLLNEELLNEGSNILLLSYTNRAVDEICSKLTEQGHDFLRLGSELSCSEEYKPYLLSERVKTLGKSTEVRQLICNTRIICGTTAALNASTSLFNIKQFSLAIIDESSQILEPHLIGLLSARTPQGQDAISRFVLIGDHKQLPAVVQQTEEESIVDDEALNAIGLTDCRLSLFERMLTRFRNDDGSYDPRYVYMLTHQGRMHQDIAEFPNRMFYGGKLKVVPLDHQQLPGDETDNTNAFSQILTAHRMAFVATESPELSVSDKTNKTEAELIARTTIEVYHKTKDHFDPQQTIGIIVPYRNQIATIRNAIDSYGIDLLHDITIDTVERYQGSQRDYILYGFTVQQRYQLNFLTNTTFIEQGAIIDRKLNVAMTRARLHLIIFGNPLILRDSPVFARLMDYAREKGCYIDKL